jgi:hypothetical protein
MSQQGESIETGTKIRRGKRAAKGAFTPNELARRFGVGIRKVLDWIRGGELRAVNVASDLRKRPQWIITTEAVAEFEAARASQPAPRVQRRRKKEAEKVIEFY